MMLKLMLPTIKVKLLILKRSKLRVVIISPIVAHSTKNVSKTDRTNLKSLFDGNQSSFELEACCQLLSVMEFAMEFFFYR